MSSFRAEWTKLRTSPGTIWLLLGVIALTVALGALADSVTHCPAHVCHADPTRAMLIGVDLSQDITVVGRNGEVARSKQLTFFQARPLAVYFSALYITAHQHHKAPVSMVGTQAGIFIGAASKFAHYNHRQIVDLAL